MNLFVAGLSYKSAPVEVREKLATQPGRFRCNACRLALTGGLREVVLLSTCNRVEVYGVAERPLLQAETLFRSISATNLDFGPYLYSKQGEDAVRHLFSVASGLDSMVLGETEITGQVKQCYLNAQAAKLTGKVTNRLFQSALQVAKEIRAGTAIGRGSTSVGSVAVDLAERIFDGDLGHRTVMIIGAGKMGEACVRHLAKKGLCSILVSNRSFERAHDLAAEFGGHAIRLEQLREGLVQADIVVSSTGSPTVILDKALISSAMSERGGRPLFLIDIAVPRDIAADVQDLPNVYLYNVDHLESIVKENVRLRQLELQTCTKIVEKRLAEFMSRLAAAAGRSETRTRSGSGLLLPPVLAYQSQPGG